MSIYQDIINTEKLLNQCFDLETGEIDEAKEQELNALHSLLIAEGAENLCKLRCNLNAEYEGLNQEKKRLDEALKRKAKNIERVENSLMFILAHSPEDKIKAGTFTVSSRKSTQVLLAEDFNDERFLIRKETVTPDKMAIKNALKLGEEITGAELVTKLNLKVA